MYKTLTNSNYLLFYLFIYLQIYLVTNHVQYVLNIYYIYFFSSQKICIQKPIKFHK